MYAVSCWRIVCSGIVSLLATALLITLGSSLLAPPALAAPNSSPDETWVTDGSVFSMAQVGNRVYLGGNFSQVGPNVGFGAAVNSTDGQRDTTFPKVNGRILAAVPDGSGGWYIGGDFTKVGSSFRLRLARVLSTGKVASWDPQVEPSQVNALALSADGKRLYVGGAFTSVGGAARNRLAAVDAATGAVDPGWNPNANGTISVLTSSSDGSRVYAGGTFTTIGTASRGNMAAVDATTGAVDPGWNPNANGTVSALSVSGSRVYAGGTFTSVGGATRNRVAAVDAATGTVDPNWNPNANFSVRALVPSADGKRIYLGGDFTDLSGTLRSRLAAVDPTTGALDKTFNAGTIDSTVRALAVAGNRLYIGGDFTSVKGQSRTRLAAVDATTGALDSSWTPAADATVRVLRLSGDGSRVYTGGAFTTISGQSRPYLAALSPVTGAPDAAWVPPKPNGPIFSLAESGGRVYTAAGGGGGAVEAYDSKTGSRAWSKIGDGDAQALLVRGDKVYAGGHFDKMDGQVRHRLVAFDMVTGAVDPQWVPEILPRSDGTGLPDSGVWAMAGVSGPRLFIGGDFQKISRLVQAGYAQFSDTDTTAPTVNAANPGDGSSGIAIASNVDVSFSEPMDEASLNGTTFTLIKQGASTPVAATVTYDPTSKKAVLDSSSDLDPDATYTATLKGGASGAKDVVGNPLATDKVWSFSTADTLAPETTIQSGPSGTVGSNSATFSFSSSEPGSSFECGLDGAPFVVFTSCTSPTTYANVTDGSHSFQVRAIDAAGNVDSTPASLTWTVDATAPAPPTALDLVASSDSGSSDSDDITKDDTPAVSGKAEAGSDVKLYDGTTLAGSVAADASGNWTIITDVLGDGRHSLTATATDVEGNTSSASDALVVTIDKSAPTIGDDGPMALPDGDNGWYKSAVTNEFSASDNVKLADPSQALFQKPSGTAEGPAVKIYSGTVADAAGNTNPGIDSAAFKIDMTAPAAPTNLDLLASSDTGTNDADNVTGDNTPTFSVDAEPGSTVRIYDDVNATPLGSATADAQGVATITSGQLADGTYAVSATTADDAGNVSPSSTTLNVTIGAADGSTPPIVTIDSKPASPTNNASPTFGFSSSEAGSTFQCSLSRGTDPDGFAACDSPEDYGPLSDGTYTFKVKATDAAGNTSDPASYEFELDATAPAASIDSGPSGTVSTDSATFTFSSESGATLECSLDGASFGNCTSPKNYTGLQDGSHTFRVRATDKAGNVSQTSSRSWTVDAASVIMAAGNIACNANTTRTDICRQMSTSDLLVNNAPDAVLPLGDDQYECGSLKDFTKYYGASWGRMKAITHPIPGNHEYSTSTTSTDPCFNAPTGAPGYFQYFGSAASPTEPGCTVNCKGYYSYDLGSWHIVALNSVCSQVGGCGKGSPQEVWLRNDLAAHPTQCTLAYWHYPRFSSSEAGSTYTAYLQTLWQDLYNAKVEVVLNAHDHIYERFAPMDTAGTMDRANGVRQFTVGTGGKKHMSIVSVQPNSEVRNTDTYGVLKMNLRPTGYDWNFMPIAGSTFTDSGSDSCH